MEHDSEPFPIKKSLKGIRWKEREEEVEVATRDWESEQGEAAVNDEGWGKKRGG